MHVLSSHCAILLQNVSRGLAELLRKIYGEIVNYSVRAATLATGVAESRLRTWERRYGIPNPGRSENGRRQYSEADIQVIRRMAALVEAGVPAAEAANVARLDSGEQAGASPVEPPIHPLVAEMVGAAQRYDEEALVRAIQESHPDNDWGFAFDRVLFPAMRSLGEGWSDEVLVSANEHFATEIVKREVCVEIARSSHGRNGRPTVLLACPEGERHDVGLLALSLLLLQRGARVVYLGADVPIADLVRSIEELQPSALCMSATLAVSLTSLRRSMRAVISSHANCRLFAGGPAVSGAIGRDIPAVLLSASLAESADMLVALRA
jgi:methanogenic corrinoid protein MtbC1